jgi:hypothetical protein
VDTIERVEERMGLKAEERGWEVGSWSKNGIRGLGQRMKLKRMKLYSGGKHGITRVVKKIGIKGKEGWTRRDWGGVAKMRLRRRKKGWDEGGRNENGNEGEEKGWDEGERKRRKARGRMWRAEIRN